MGEWPEHDRRSYDRYETDLKVRFRVNFDVRTRVDFRIKEAGGGGEASDRHHAVSRNVNVEGMGIRSPVELQPGDLLALEVYVPAVGDPIPMEAEVRWCRAVDGEPEGDLAWDVGLRILKVAGEEVAKTIFMDRIHNVMWSIVLETVFSSFKESLLKRRRIRKEDD